MGGTRTRRSEWTVLLFRRMEPDRFQRLGAFCFCHVCNSNKDKAMYYVCLTCPPGPFGEICEDCYLSDRKGSHGDCEFDAVFPEATPSAWLQATCPAIDKASVPSLPKNLVVRGLVRTTGEKECVLGHAFVVGDRVYAANHSLAPIGGAKMRDISLFDLPSGELGAWMTREMKGVMVRPEKISFSSTEDWAVFEIVRNAFDNGVRMASKRPAVDDPAFVMTAYAVFSCVVLDGGDCLVLLCSLSPARELLLSGSPIVDSAGQVFGILTTGGTLPPNRRLFGGAFLV